MNAWLFNLLQSLLVIFVGVEFVWRDRQLGTNETFLSRSETNMEYMFGKIWGVMKICLLLNFVSIGIAIMIHLLFMETVAFNPFLYLFYLLTLTFPALVFVLGISLFVAMLIRNHYLALLLLMIGFIGCYFAAPWTLYGMFIHHTVGDNLDPIILHIFFLGNPESYTSLIYIQVSIQI